MVWYITCLGNLSRCSFKLFLGDQPMRYNILALFAFTFAATFSRFASADFRSVGPLPAVTYLDTAVHKDCSYRIRYNRNYPGKTYWNFAVESFLFQDYSELANPAGPNFEMSAAISLQEWVDFRGLAAEGPVPYGVLNPRLVFQIRRTGIAAFLEYVDSKDLASSIRSENSLFTVHRAAISSAELGSFQLQRECDLTGFRR